MLMFATEIENENSTYEVKSEKRKRKWNFFRVLLALVLVVCVFWLIFGFLTKPDNSKPVTYRELLDSNPIITENGVAIIVDGVKVKESIWNYYFMQNVKDYVSSTGVELSEINWGAEHEKGTVLEFIKYNAINDILVNIAITSKANEWGISLTDEDLGKLTELDGLKKVYGDRIYEEYAIADEMDFDIIRKNILLEEKVRAAVGMDTEKYADGENLTEYADGESATVKVIEIPKEYADTGKSYIKQVKARLEKREAFDKLWKETVAEFNKNRQIGEDDKPDVLYVYKDGVAKSYEEMENAVLSLEIGGVSDVVETDYSYMVLKRIAGYTEVVNMIISECDIKLNKEIIDSTTVEL